jgi:membrane-associated protease RseP (regulator of RpoE activity)
VGTLTGDRPQQVGRLAETLAIGDFTLPRPIVDLTDELSSLGGEGLRNFSVTFDQARNRVTFQRDSRDPILSPSRRSAGVSFNKTPAYWRIAGVVPDSPAAATGVQAGDLVTRINGEPIAKWDLTRYEQLIATADEISFSFLNGSVEAEKRLRVFELVP